MKETLLDKIKKEHASFEALQYTLSKLGAEDTEPDYIYQRAVHDSFYGVYPILTGENPWQLYSGMTGCSLANRKLFTKLMRVVNLILSAKVSELPDIKRWGMTTLWRIDCKE